MPVERVRAGCGARAQLAVARLGSARGSRTTLRDAIYAQHPRAEP